ncbi:META domain-containing protein [Subtercola endophyticus]|uniref:META domain-containing protein n=1 Tax=Subtercola endophyticus TaxID=2895559 RepID=UPI001E636A83|nr:META domain-containing protein [Subtercola endophyticus]UFS57616.1 META domain-containing protein [Subtercola endophyticus]
MKLLVARIAMVATAAFTLMTVSGCSSSGSAFAGSWGTDSPGQPSLSIQPDGTFSGTDGCNRLMGKGTASGDTFDFGTFASTMMWCEGVTTWLNLASTAKIDGTKLVVFQSTGEQIGTLAKQ